MAETLVGRSVGRPCLVYANASRRAEMLYVSKRGKYAKMDRWEPLLPADSSVIWQHEDKMRIRLIEGQIQPGGPMSDRGVT